MHQFTFPLTVHEDLPYCKSSPALVVSCFFYNCHSDRHEVFYSNGSSEKAGVIILTSSKIHFKTKAVTRDKERYYIMVKGSTQEEGIAIVNICVPNIGAPKYIKQILTDRKKLTITQ